MNMQMHTPFSNLHYYRLEPHDGTRYEFFFFDPTARLGTDLLETEYVKQHINSRILPRTLDRIPINGIFNGEGYVIFGIVMPNGQGVYPVRTSMLLSIQKAWLDGDEPGVSKLLASMIEDFNGHTGRTLHPPTIAVCLLALSMLISNPQALENAVEIAQRGIYIYTKILELSEEKDDAIQDQDFDLEDIEITDSF